MIILSREELKDIVADAYAEGYKKCLTDVVHRSNFIYEVIAEKAKQDIEDQYGVIPEVTEEEWRAANAES